MAASSSAVDRRPPRRLGDWTALAVLGALFFLQLVYLGINVAASNLVIAAAEYRLDIYIDAEYQDWVLENTSREIRSAFRDVLPTFRQHKPEIDIEPRRILVTVLIKNGVDVRPIFESIGQRLNEPLRERWQRPTGTSVVRLANIEVTPYPWFKPLDLVSLVVLFGAAGAWIFFP